MQRIPDLSILIATHDRPRELRRALTSIRESVEVSHEIIVIADDRNHETRAVISDLLTHNDTYIERAGPAGPARSRNLGFKFCRSPHTLIFDDDDQLPGPSYGKFLESALSQDVLSYGDVVIVYEDRVKGTLTETPPVYPNLTNFDIDQLWVKNFIVTPAVIFPSRLLLELQQDPSMRSLEDWEFLLATYQLVDFRPIQQLAAIIYKDMVNMGNRRGSADVAIGRGVLSEYLYVYKKWPAPSRIAKMRRDFLASIAPDFVRSLEEVTDYGF